MWVPFPPGWSVRVRRIARGGRVLAVGDEHRIVVGRVVHGAALGAAVAVVVADRISVYWSTVQPGNFVISCARFAATPEIPISMLTSGSKIDVGQLLDVMSVVRFGWPFGRRPALSGLSPHAGTTCMRP